MAAVDIERSAAGRLAHSAGPNRRSVPSISPPAACIVLEGKVDVLHRAQPARHPGYRCEPSGGPVFLIAPPRHSRLSRRGRNPAFLPARRTLSAVDSVASSLRSTPLPHRVTVTGIY